MQKENKMGVMPIPKLVLSMSIPIMISMLVQSMYNIVDSIFVARISESALTAASLAYSAQILQIAVAVGTGVGVNALVSRRLGAKEYQKANEAAATGLLLTLLSSLLFVLWGLPPAGPSIVSQKGQMPFSHTARCERPSRHSRQPPRRLSAPPPPAAPRR